MRVKEFKCLIRNGGSLLFTIIYPYYLLTALSVHVAVCLQLSVAVAIFSYFWVKVSSSVASILRARDKGSPSVAICC